MCRKRMKGGRPPLLLAVCLSLLLSLPSCKPAEVPSRSQTRFLFDTVVTLTAWDPYTNAYYSAVGKSRPDLDKVLAGAMALCQRYEALFSRTKEGSDVWRINHARGMPVEVDGETAALLTRCRYYSELTQGAFDVTIAPVSGLWDFHSDTPVVPDGDALAEAAARVDYRRLSVEGRTVVLPADMAVDLGGAAKGYIADQVAAYFLEQGVDSALLNFGGNVMAVGGKANKQESRQETARHPFSIGVRDPAGGQADLAATAYIESGSVVTSGVYERYFEKDGRRYHHILSPVDGWPVDNGLTSVTIFSEGSTDGDILSTACFVLGREKGMELIESQEGVEALFIDNMGNIAASSGLLIEGREIRILS